MPELPEVETIRSYLASRMTGCYVSDVLHLDPRMIKLGEHDATGIREQIVGSRLSGVHRRGKYLLLLFEPHGLLVIHLGMSGRLTVNPGEDLWRPHTHLVLRFGDTDLRLSDPRRFGRIGWVSNRAAIDRRLGVEPLGTRFTGAHLWGLIRQRAAPIKSLLLNQSVVAGLGNIYADEALFLSRIHPACPGKKLDQASSVRLVRNIRRVLRQSIAHRGTSFSDYVDALGKPGRNQNHLNVYGRAGQACGRCRTPIATMVIQGRTSHFCPRCQPLSWVQTDQPRVRNQG